LAAPLRDRAPQAIKGTRVDTEATAAGDDGVARPIGAILAAARQAQGLDLTDVARDTRVPLRHLTAIEADAHDSLPALPYTIGFVKAFARVVGVDPDMAGARFRAETSKAAHVPVAPAMTPLDERRLPPRGLIMLSVAALVAVIAVIVAWSAGALDGPRPAPVVAAAMPSDTLAAASTTVSPAAVVVPPPGSPPAAPVAMPPAAQVAAPSATVAAAPTGPATAVATGTGPVVITASEDAWVRISVFDPAMGKTIAVKTGVLAKGERFVPPPTPGLRLWTGRAGALAITVDGRAVPPLGGPVETVKNVSLDAADLRARLTGPTRAALPGRAGPPVG